MAATHFDYRPENMQAAYQAFKKAYPGFESTKSIDELRAREYARLEEEEEGVPCPTRTGLKSALSRLVIK